MHSRSSRNPLTQAPTAPFLTLIREGSGWRVVGCPDVKRSSPGTPPPANPTPRPNKPRAAARAAGAKTATTTAEKQKTWGEARR
ncbi:hypothetical protein GCM10009864_50190 [Streptomyces lunalinharesii]|uniref:Transposase n=1 Tax=Streptomyces lunalinharesii TaxID=333384 RepID=A0ABN3SDE9_9ACTN